MVLAVAGMEGAMKVVVVLGVVVCDDKVTIVDKDDI